MRYLVTMKDDTPFYTEWFDAENNYVEGMVVYDLDNDKYTEDGTTWQEITYDQL